MLTSRQLEIIHASHEIIAGQGIQGLTIKNLSRSIGISEPAIYRHYDNKISILLALLEYFKSNMENVLKNEIRKKGSSFDKMKGVFTSHFKAFSATPSMVAVVFAEEIFRNEPILHKKLHDIMEFNDRILTDLITEGQKNNEIRTDVEPKYISIILMGSLRLLVKKWQNTEYSFNLTEEGTKLYTTLKTLIINNQ
ncbi:MAG: TetR/AcrR family transcriptional regulator [Bacteroidales bacterium]|nr:TetR/AcrR family transcriptional regulator [Bacteroidales bacterium]MDZ4205185.1 TetR/AcrR family transcriptional regulator [Bacteroidales bacterium]